ncbi:cbb3-type cytochrome c oxidase subunit I [Dendrosporobacter sp. 1207_IL3150]|uniref:cbb3-type cytochrome c oxidase subunit I n=1 Tax=Dendrosporobacter sp. 1207_IL3150 TaxID=3084054 RepID=UPI002FDA5C71
MIRSQHLSCKYALAAFLLFGLQGIVANGGAIELVLSDLRLPIDFTAGRSFHLNISIYWTLIGMMGAIYFFFSQETKQEIYIVKHINFNFWLIIATIGMSLGSLLLGFNDGREYLEAVWPLKILLAGSTLIFGYMLFRTYLNSIVPKSRATLISMLAGSLTLAIFYLPNIVSYDHPSIDEMMKYLVVHLWEEMTLELMGTGVLAALLINMTKADRRVAEAAIYLDISFMALGGILATGHHYYWIGVPELWIWIGGFFSAIQIIPTIVLLYAVFQTTKFESFSKFNYHEKITLMLIGSSMFYHIFGAGFTGLFMAYPPINRYIHGTYIVSAHSHLALFGVFGFLVLAVSFYILFTKVTLSKTLYQWCVVAIFSLNLGLLTMSAGLTIAGGLQAYCWYVFGLSTADTNTLIKPYLAIRILGGLMYSAGSTILTYAVLKSIWPQLKSIFTDNCYASDNRYYKERLVLTLFKSLIKKQREAAALLQKIKEIVNRSVR